MTFPTHSDSAVTTVPSGTNTSFSVTLPSYSSGDMVIIGCKQNSNGSSVTATGWTTLAETTGSAPRTGAVLGRVMDGTEGSTVTVNFSFSGQAAFVAVAIAGHAGSISNAYAASATHNFASPDPPNLAPGVGAKDFLWLEVAGNRGGDGVFSASTSFSAFTDGDAENSTDGQSCAMFYRTLNASSLNPDAMSYSGTNQQGTSFTVAIEPAAGGGGVDGMPSPLGLLTMGMG